MPTKVQKERVGKLIAKWKTRLLLSNWSVVPVYKDEDEVDSHGLKTVASMWVNDRYTEGRLTLYPKFWQESKPTQEATIVHELYHLITEPARDVLCLAVARKVISEKKRDDVVEKLTEHMCKIVFKSHKKECPEHII